MAKKATVTKSPEGGPKETVPKDATKGRSPLKRATVYLRGYSVAEFGVSASKKTVMRVLRVVADPKAPPQKEASGTAEEEAGVVEDAPRGKKEAKAGTNGTQLFLELKEGKQEPMLTPLDEQQAGEYTSFMTDLLAVQGVNILKRVPATEVMRYPHTNVWFLHAYPDVGESVKIYRMLWENLYSGYKAVIAEYVYGKNVSLVAIVAVDEGLVMWQIPQLEAAHFIGDAIDTALFKAAAVVPNERDLFTRVLENMSADSLEPTDLQDRRTLFLEALLTKQRASGTIMRSVSGKEFPDLVSVLTTLLEEKE
ncbi:MAG: hypothetical protein KDD69_07075 [Bdellovibrionales bacterium]|nr:hypothetical protein [Bdellovibrionales bacterium]